MASATIYVDEKAGSDETGKGTESAPFASALAAYLSVQPEASDADKEPFGVVNILTLKAEGDEPATYVELSASAKKKLVKGIEGQRKKQIKQAADAQRLEKEHAEAEARDKLRREEASKIELVEPKDAELVSKESIGTC
jgi:asparaginyl-tRNA synthetase